jgi:enoyl-CoA hydratase/carnithine racemase
VETGGMSTDTVQFSELPVASGRCFGRATLNAPATLNALTLSMVEQLDARLRAWAADPRVVGVWLDASSDKAFCAGGDVVSLYHAIRATPAGTLPALASSFFEREYRLDHLIHTYPKPIVCWGHGIVMGGGVGLMVGASHRVATPHTRLAMPEISIGLYPDVGGSWFLGRLPGGLGEFLALTGAPLNASDLLELGLADAVLRHEDRASVWQALAAHPWTGQADLDRAALSQLLHQHALPASERPASAVRAHRDRLAELMLRHLRLHDLAPRLATLASADDPWLAQAARQFASGCPTSAHLALTLQRRLRHASLAEALRLEWLASTACCLQPDFPEGVRALLIDKDRRPRWHPDRLEAWDEARWSAHIATHLEPRGPHPLADLS